MYCCNVVSLLIPVRTYILLSRFHNLNFRRRLLFRKCIPFSASSIFDASGDFAAVKRPSCYWRMTRNPFAVRLLCLCLLPLLLFLSFLEWSTSRTSCANNKTSWAFHSESLVPHCLFVKFQKVIMIILFSSNPSSKHKTDKMHGSDRPWKQNDRTRSNWRLKSKNLAWTLTSCRLEKKSTGIHNNA